MAIKPMNSNKPGDRFYYLGQIGKRKFWAGYIKLSKYFLWSHYYAGSQDNTLKFCIGKYFIELRTKKMF